MRRPPYYQVATAAEALVGGGPFCQFMIETRSRPELAMDNFLPGPEGASARAKKLGEMYHALSPVELAGLEQRAANAKKNPEEVISHAKELADRVEKQPSTEMTTRVEKLARLFKSMSPGVLAAHRRLSQPLQVQSMYTPRKPEYLGHFDSVLYAEDGEEDVKNTKKKPLLSVAERAKRYEKASRALSPGVVSAFDKYWRPSQKKRSFSKRPYASKRFEKGPAACGASEENSASSTNKSTIEPLLSVGESGLIPEVALKKKSSFLKWVGDKEDRQESEERAEIRSAFLQFIFEKKDHPELAEVNFPPGPLATVMRAKKLSEMFRALSPRELVALKERGKAPRTDKEKTNGLGKLSFVHFLAENADHPDHGIANFPSGKHGALARMQKVYEIYSALGPEDREALSERAALFQQFFEEKTASRPELRKNVKEVREMFGALSPEELAALKERLASGEKLSHVSRKPVDITAFLAKTRYRPDLSGAFRPLPPGSSLVKFRGLNPDDLAPEERAAISKKLFYQFLSENENHPHLATEKFPPGGRKKKLHEMYRALNAGELSALNQRATITNKLFFDFVREMKSHPDLATENFAPGRDGVSAQWKKLREMYRALSAEELNAFKQRAAITNRWFFVFVLEMKSHPDLATENFAPGRDGVSAQWKKLREMYRALSAEELNAFKQRAAINKKLFFEFVRETKTHPDLAREKFPTGRVGVAARKKKLREMYRALTAEELAALRKRAANSKEDRKRAAITEKLFLEFVRETEDHPDLAKANFSSGPDGASTRKKKTRDMFNSLSPKERAALKVRAFDLSYFLLFSAETKNHPDLSMANFPPGTEGRLARNRKFGEMFRALSKEEIATLKKRAEAKENRRAALSKVHTAKPEKTFLPSAEMFRALSSQEIAALSERSANPKKSLSGRAISKFPPIHGSDGVRKKTKIGETHRALGSQKRAGQKEERKRTEEKKPSRISSILKPLDPDEFKHLKNRPTFP